MAAGALFQPLVVVVVAAGAPLQEWVVVVVVVAAGATLQEWVVVEEAQVVVEGM